MGATLVDAARVLDESRADRRTGRRDPHGAATPFVAGFVGTSNLLAGAVAEAIVGKPGTFTVRPEKIRLADPDVPAGDDESSALGRIRTVVYLGPDTRYVVALDAGSELVVTEQNLTTSSMEALAAEGRRVRLIWKRQHNFAVGG